MEPHFDDELATLANALRYQTFRFILIGHNRYSLYTDIAAWIRGHVTHREVHELRLRELNDYRHINDALQHFRKGIVLIPDFDWLLRGEEANSDACVAFNQRRDAFARLDIAFVCFIEPGNYINVPTKVPDWWSLRSLELDFERGRPDSTFKFAPSEELDRYAFDNLSLAEKQAEINRILRQLDVAEENNGELRHLLCGQLGTLYYLLAEYETALVYLQQSLSISQRLNDKRGEGTTLNDIGQIYHERGDYETALYYFQQSLSIQQQISDRQGESITLNNIGQTYYVWGDYETALTHLRNSLSISQLLDKKAEATTLDIIGQIYYAQKDYKTALTYFQQSLDISQQAGDERGKGATLNNIGQVHYVQGDYEIALTYLQRSLNIDQQIGDRQGEGTTLSNIGQIHDARGEYELALDYLKWSLSIRQQIGNRRGEAVSLHNIAAILFEHFREMEQAAKFFSKAYTIFKQIGSPDANTSSAYLKSIEDEIGAERLSQLLDSD